MKLMNDKREYFEQIINKKRDKLLKKIDDLDSHKHHTFDQIDTLFADVIERIKARQEALKKEYETIEQKERTRLESLREKVMNDSSSIKTFS